jgi:predicted nucleotidyltransferase
MTTPKLHRDLSEFLCCLARHKVRFVVIGAHVLATLGRPRYTDDLDVLVEPTYANAKRLSEAFAAFGYPELAAQAVEHFLEPERMATLGRPPVAIDVLTSTPGISFKEAWAGRQIVTIDGVQVGFLGLAEFVKTKLACGRTKDLLDIELLREVGLVPNRTKPAKRLLPKRPKRRR